MLELEARAVRVFLTGLPFSADGVELSALAPSARAWAEHAAVTTGDGAAFATFTPPGASADQWARWLCWRKFFLDDPLPESLASSLEGVSGALVARSARLAVPVAHVLIASGHGASGCALVRGALARREEWCAGLPDEACAEARGELYWDLGACPETKEDPVAKALRALWACADPRHQGETRVRRREDGRWTLSTTNASWLDVACLKESPALGDDGPALVTLGNWGL